MTSMTATKAMIATASHESVQVGGVSFKNRRWELPQVGADQVAELVAAGADALTAPIIAARGIAPEGLADFLKPKIRNLLPNPAFFQDMDKAAARIARAIMDRETIAIWSDYDVDGATSAGTLGRFLRDCGITDFMLRIPDRIVEGYGPNAQGLLELGDAGATLVVVLDSGTTAHEPLQAAHDAGLDVVVIDHHAAEAVLPPAVALVNPNRLDQAPGYNHVCAAGMTFIACVAINMALRGLGFFDGQDGRPARSPELMTYLDLVALGTVCDVVPLKGINRAFVSVGLQTLSERRLPGIRALAEVAGCNAEIDVRDCGFGLGPRINAGGRIGAADSGARLLLAEDEEEAKRLAEDLNLLNQGRQDLEKACTAAALAQVTDFVPGVTRRLAVAIVDAHEGIVGISAARVKEAVDAPAFVLTATPEGHLKGSGRSVTGFDLGAAIIAARQAGLLLKGGGHAMAGGITLEADQVAAFTAFVDAEIARSDYARIGVVTTIDMEVPVTRATVGLADAVQSLAPFGMGNPTPRFLIRNVRLAELRTLKERHLKCVFEHPRLGHSGPRLEAPIWNAVDTPLAEALADARGQEVDLLCALEVNEWRNVRKIQLKIEDVRLSDA